MDNINKLSKYLQISNNEVINGIKVVLKKYDVGFEITDTEASILYLYDYLEIKNGRVIVEFEGYTNLYDIIIRDCFKYELNNNAELIEGIFRLLKKYNIKY